MKSAVPRTTARLDIVDALRGSALLCILLLHAVEHWDVMRPPSGRPAWLEMLDGQTVGWAYLLLGGKAYAIFALMFGVSFFITLDSWRRKGDDGASARFAWRMALLGLLGYVHGLIYEGDILGPIALLGVPLLLLDRLCSRGLGVAAVLLLLQLPQWAEALRVLADPSWQPGTPRFWDMFGRAGEVFATGSLADVLVPYGRMSLTCYVTQAVIGVPFFFTFGLGMYRHVGPFAALFFALAVFALQCAFAHAWLKRYAYGPLEWLWRAATLRTLQVPMRRAAIHDTTQETASGQASLAMEPKT